MSGRGGGVEWGEEGRGGGGGGGRGCPLKWGRMGLHVFGKGPSLNET